MDSLFWKKGTWWKGTKQHLIGEQSIRNFSVCHDTGTKGGWQVGSCWHWAIISWNFHLRNSHWKWEFWQEFQRNLVFIGISRIFGFHCCTLLHTFLTCVFTTGILEKLFTFLHFITYYLPSHFQILSHYRSCKLALKPGRSCLKAYSVKSLFSGHFSRFHFISVLGGHIWMCKGTQACLPGW